jgi:hypothetical protein
VRQPHEDEGLPSAPAPLLGQAQPPRHVEARAVPAGELLDAHARARVRRVDEPSVADVDADVPEAVEEDRSPGRSDERETRLPSPACA